MKRFYKSVLVGEDLSVLLDGKPIATPAGARLALPTRALADAIAEEWRGQGEIIDPASMPLTKLANTAIDRAAALREDIAVELLRFGMSDLLCYRAIEPDALIARQHAHWTPLLDWAHQTHGARLKWVYGVTHVEQDAGALAALGRALGELDDWTLTGLQTITSITGSLILALAAAAGRLTPLEAFEISRLDETFQAERWGSDSAAEQRAALLAREVEMAGKFTALART